MKEFSPNKISLFYTLTTLASVLACVFLSDLIFNLQIRWSIVLIVSAIFGLISFFVLRLFLYKFIYDRIRLIYKTIRKRKEGKNKKNLSKVYSRDLIHQVESDVNDWVNEQEKEMAQIVEMSNYRKEFVGNVAHELKTPIFNIQGYTLTLLEGGLQDESINEKYLKKIEKNINRMINIVSDLDTITKLESGQLVLNNKTFDPVILCNECFESLEEMIKSKEIKIELIQHYDKALMVKADREHISQVFSNLIINAVNYNNQGGIVKAEFFEMGKDILIEITDNGVGIPSEDLPRVFERFYRVDKSRSLNSGGSGLGLAIVKHIVEAHGQRVNVRSSVGIGTTVAFTLRKG
ncbi:MAG: ATP-binding protein [Bacteroidales bacterium]|nr:ATP-binding protein [Bacteroidales bacterium]MDD3859453.1 ATP-binding protein [Bacteroidales bacterium]